MQPEFTERKPFEQMDASAVAYVVSWCPEDKYDVTPKLPSSFSDHPLGRGWGGNLLLMIEILHDPMYTTLPFQGFGIEGHAGFMSSTVPGHPDSMYNNGPKPLNGAQKAVVLHIVGVQVVTLRSTTLAFEAKL